MFEVNKELFGSFVAEQRKRKGYTQRELAERLFVSDKAVSKWERGLSMPDISLLIPLAEVLEVSVTELLEGRRLAQMEERKQDEVERLVKKALLFSEEAPEKKRERRKRHALLFGGCCLAAALEVLIFFLLGELGIGGGENDSFSEGAFLWGTSFFVFELLSLIFGSYFWLFMKERLPLYYDENKISAYSDGIFRMNLPGVSFNNSNWPPIVKILRLWSAATLLFVPLVCFGFSIVPMEAWMVIAVQNVMLLGYLLSLLVPVYVVGRKYGMSSEKSVQKAVQEAGDSLPQSRSRQNMPGRWKKRLIVLGTILSLTTMSLFGILFIAETESFSGIRIGFVSGGGRREWTASYSLLDGQFRKKIYPAITDSQEGIPYVMEIETKQGRISIDVTDKKGTVIFSVEEIEPGEYPVVLEGTVEVRITAEKHVGSFAIRERE